MIKVVMVCLGNICRSPLAEGILRHKAGQKSLNIIVDSAGTANYHMGEHPDHRSVKKAKEYGINISKLKGRQFTVIDFDNFDHIYVMDQSNYRDVTKLARNENDKRKVKLILNMAFPKLNMEVPDPYYGGDEGFEHVFQLLDKACESIVNEIEEKNF
ncbi:MAG: low molecular weight phosphotyrosine protein phosphatase [Bacteroidetes bacterium]|nr:low molecular weight phosphotyrosine protein phosphatase [Bacteroidota bacterium]